MNVTDTVILLTYVQLTIVEAILLYLMFGVHRWVRKFGPVLEAFGERFGIEETPGVIQRLARSLKTGMRNIVAWTSRTLRIGKN